MDFDKAFELVIGHEGGYVNNPKDPGGETKFGISKRAYPNEDIKNLTLEKAKFYYKRDYWDAIKADQLPPELRFHIFDAAVNSGVKQASIWLQKACKVKVDGVVSPGTIEASKSLSGAFLAAAFNGVRLEFMTSLPIWSEFGRGWARRIAANLQMR